MAYLKTFCMDLCQKCLMESYSHPLQHFEVKCIIFSKLSLENYEYSMQNITESQKISVNIQS